MPVVFRQGGYRFHFYSNEGDPLEPVHVHVQKDDADAKVWLYPNVTLAYNRGFNARALGEIIGLVERRRAQIERAWNDHFR
jgi:hypothetical protein